MNRDLQLSRPRLKGVRTEVLLRGVECRITRQIATLSNYHDFPTDPHDVPIILRTVFKLLDAEPFPVRPASRYSPAAQAVKQSFHCVFGWMDILAISIRKLSSVSQTLVDTALDVHEQNLHILIRWMKFYLRERSWIFELSAYYQHGDDSAPRLVAEALNNLNQASSRHRILSTMRDSEDVVDILVSIWMWQDENGDALYLKYPPSHTKGRAIICPIIRLFSTFCLHDSPFLVWEKMCTLSSWEHSRFIRCSISRIEQWRPPPRDSSLLSRSTMPINGLETLLMALTALHFVPQSARAFIKGNVVGHTIRQAQLYGSDLPCIGSSRASFATKLTYSLFYTQGCSDVADLKNRVMCQVLESGGLDTFLDYMFATHDANPTIRLHSERQDNRDVTEMNPLAYLAPFCVHRRVCDATLAAIDAILLNRMEELETGWIAEYWKPFDSTVRLYEHIWKHRIPSDRVVLCDNLKHTSTSSCHMSKAKECSHCRSVVYCSSRCQQGDWENHGGKECSLMRVYRVERELRSAWISHRTRSFFLSLIQQFLLNLEVGLSLETISGELSDDGSTLTYTPPDRQTPSSGDKAPTLSQVTRHLVKFDTTQVPCETHLQMVDEMGKARISKELENCVSNPDSRIPRFNKILLESLEAVMTSADRALPNDGPAEGSSPRPTLGICESSLGDFRIGVFGRFTVENDGVTTRVNLLNGYVRVEPGKEYDNLFGI